jgi:xanthine dehydrogenase YagS FAD-binding subunit
MKNFKHFNAKTTDEAVELLCKYKGKARIIAGGTDLMGTLKNNIHPLYPEVIINIKTIPDLSYIREQRGILRIGALTTLCELAESPLLKNQYVALADAAKKTASALLRNIATLGGNICQENRCWYYRYPHHLGGRVICLRKGGKICDAIKGDSRYHSIFGGVRGCIAVNPSDTAPALIALGARMKTSKRYIDSEKFFAVDGLRTTVLDEDELLTEIEIPVPDAGFRSSFIKFANRESIDFPIVNCAAALGFEGEIVKKARICLNAVYNTPYRVIKAEDVVIGNPINDSIAETAADAGVSGSKPLTKNKYKVQIAKVMIKRSLLACQ